MSTIISQGSITHGCGADDARAAVSISKYPPLGHRSMIGQLPQFRLSTNPLPKVISQANEYGSTVIIMIETSSAITGIDAIAAVSGVDVLLVGSNDLSIELGVPGQFESTDFQDALRSVSAACHKHGKVMGLAGIYDNEKLHAWAIHELGVGFILAQQDSGWIAKGSKACIEVLNKIVTPN
jgi:2-keto-3-deoxy-L-rhamnonate aldolase RhmA